MIGEKAYQNALRRRAELRQELQDIETFLQLCERFAGDNSVHDARAIAGESAAPTSSGATNVVLDQGGIEIGGNALRPHIRKAILDVGRPLSRVETVRALKERDIRVAGRDQVVNVGVVLWRAKDEFVNLKPYGYWPRDVAYVPAGYDPAGQEDDALDGDDESDAPVEAPKDNGDSANL